MRRLTVLRHAHASDGPMGGKDFDRPLSARGRASASELGQRFAARLPAPDRLWHSPARRTRETAQLACAAAWPTSTLEAVPALYNATVDGLLREIASAPEGCGHLLIVGHNPALSELWTMLGDEPGFAGLAPCDWRSRELDLTGWSDLAPP